MSTDQTPALIRHLQSPEMEKQFAAVLPAICTPERFTRFALSSVRRVPKLLDCDPKSVMSAFMTCAELGIEPDGRRAHLIPYGRECTLIIDWKGMKELVLRSGFVAFLHAGNVHEGDHFRYGINATGPFLEWEPMTAGGKRGDIIGAFAVAKMKSGELVHEFMTLDEIKAIQARSKAGRSGPWTTDFGEMAKKTVLRRLMKGLPMSPELQKAIEADDRQFERTHAAPVAPLFKSVGKAELAPESDLDPIDVEELPMGDETEGGE